MQGLILTLARPVIPMQEGIPMGGLIPIPVRPVIPIRCPIPMSWYKALVRLKRSNRKVVKGLAKK